MKVAVLGTGYVGLTTAVSLAYLGHEVVGVDVDEANLVALRWGKLLYRLRALLRGRFSWLVG